MRSRLRLLALALLPMLLAVPAAAEPLRTFHVAATGDDRADGSAARPWRTLQRAASAARAGDLVIVHAGHYAGFDLRTDGTADQPIVFQAEPGVVVDTPNPVTPSHGINLEGASFVVVEGFTVTGMPRAGIRSVTNHHVTIRGNVMDANGFWGFLSGFSDDLLIEDNEASRSVNEHGIYVSNSGDRPVIRGNHVWGNRGNGIHMNGDLSMGGDGIISGALVEANVIHGNGRGGGSGINADGVQGSRFVNNLLYDNHASGISLYRIDGAEGSRDNLVAHNTIVQAADGRWAVNIQGGSTGTTLLNNILLSLHPYRGAIDVSADSLPGLTSDHNAVIARFTLNGGGSVLDLAAWRSRTGQDLHSIVSTPAALFVDPAADFHLRVDAAARDAAPRLADVPFDLEGTPRTAGAGADMGADEYGDVAPPPPPPPPPSLANLVEVAVSNPPATIARGKEFSVTDTVRNAGTSRATSSVTRYFLSSDAARSGADALLSGSRSVPTLAAGTSSTGTVGVRVPRSVAPGTYFLLACADHRLTVAEGDETDNCTASASPVVVR